MRTLCGYRFSWNMKLKAATLTITTKPLIVSLNVFSRKKHKKLTKLFIYHSEIKVSQHFCNIYSIKTNATHRQSVVHLLVAHCWRPRLFLSPKCVKMNRKVAPSASHYHTWTFLHLLTTRSPTMTHKFGTNPFFTLSALFTSCNRQKCGMWMW